MKKIILLILAPFLLLKLQACNVENLKTKEQVKVAQECMIKTLESLDKHFKTYDIYTGKVKEKNIKLNKEEALCKSITIFYKETNMNNSDYNNCKSLYKMRLVEFTEVTEQWQRLSQKIKNTKNQKIAIELKKSLLQSTYDLIIKRNNR